MFRLAAIFALLAGSAWAGAWPREAGRGFVAVSSEFGGFDVAEDIGDLEVFNNLYLEYGLTERLTLGLDIGHKIGFDPNTRVFARLPLWQSAGQALAVEASLGVEGAVTLYALGLNYGRGFDLAGTPGWFGVDTRWVEAEGDGAEFLRQTKIDVTAGLSFDNGVKAITQVFHTQVGDTAYSSLAPSLVVPITAQLQLQTGVLFDLQHGAAPVLKLGLWQDF